MSSGEARHNRCDFTCIGGSRRIVHDKMSTEVKQWGRASGEETLSVLLSGFWRVLLEFFDSIRSKCGRLLFTCKEVKVWTRRSL